MKRTISRRRKLAFTGVAFLIAFAALEVATRSYDAIRGRGFFSNSRSNVFASRGFKPYTMFGFDWYKTVDGKRKISSRHGELYDFEKPSGTYRVVVFGGSTTENLVAYEAAGVHYPKLLEARLREATGRQNIEVINVGKSAYTTLHSLLLFELNVVSWDPDLIIVSHNVNDLMTSYWPDFEVDYSHKYFTDHYLPDFKKRYATHNRILAHSEFYCAIKGRFDELTRRKSIPIVRESTGDQPSNDATIVFERNLKSIVAVAKQHGIEVMLGTQLLEPSEAMFVKHMSHKQYNGLVTYPLHSEFVAHHRRYNDLLRAVAEETGCSLADPQAVIGDETEYFHDFVHYTPAGVEGLAAVYAKAIQTQVFQAQN